MTFHHTREVLVLELQMQRLVVKRQFTFNLLGLLVLLFATDTLVKPLEGYAVHR